MQPSKTKKKKVRKKLPKVLCFFFFLSFILLLLYIISVNMSLNAQSDEVPLHRNTMSKRPPQQDYYFEADLGYQDHVCFDY